MVVLPTPPFWLAQAIVWPIRPPVEGCSQASILPSGARPHARGPVFAVVLPIVAVVALREAHRGASWSPQAPCARCCTCNSPGPLQARSGGRQGAIPGASAARPCIRPAGEREWFQVARASPDAASAPIGTRGGQTANPTSYRTGPAHRRHPRADGRMFHCDTLRRGSGRFPYRNGLGILLHDVAALGRRGRSRIRRAAGHKAEVRLSRCV